jgi:hypothetical protein
LNDDWSMLSQSLCSDGHARWRSDSTVFAGVVSLSLPRGFHFLGAWVAVVMVTGIFEIIREELLCIWSVWGEDM